VRRRLLAGGVVGVRALVVGRWEEQADLVARDQQERDRALLLEVVERGDVSVREREELARRLA
jgi:hypothetical protein